MHTLRFFERLSPAKRVLIAGAGGGFDIFCGLPLFHHLRSLGKEVFLANLSFSQLGPARADKAQLSEHVVEVNASSSGSSVYFPERYLCEWLDAEGLDGRIFCFAMSGVRPLAEAYAALVGHLSLDAIVLVDGGTDSLMRGDEVGLGTPHGDILSLVAAHSTDVETKLLACVGFGIDTFHGICHAQFLEAVAALSRENDYLGVFSLLEDMPEVQLYKEATEYVFSRMPQQKSIVNASILSALEGAYGDVHRTERTAGSRLWINPLMSMFWTFQLDAVARRLLYLEAVRKTETYNELALAISNFRCAHPHIKEWESIPV